MIDDEDDVACVAVQIVAKPLAVADASAHKLILPTTRSGKGTMDLMI